MEFSTLLDRARSTISTDQLLRNQLLWMLLLRSILYTLLLAISYIFQSSHFDIIVLPSNLLILLAPGSLPDNHFLSFSADDLSGKPAKFRFYPDPH